MRKLFLIIMFGMLCIHSFAQLAATQLEECYGEIRANMVRDACMIADYRNEEVIGLINNSSINEFLSNLQTDQEQRALYQVVKESNRALSGTDIDSYDKTISAIRASFESKLLGSFPNKRNEIIATYGKHIDTIKALTDECKVFNGCTETEYKDYVTKHPHGRFISLIPADIIDNKDTAQPTKDASSKVKGDNNSQKSKATHPKEKGFLAQLGYIIKIFFYVLAALLLLLAIACTYNKKVYKMIISLIYSSKQEIDPDSLKEESEDAPHPANPQAPPLPKDGNTTKPGPIPTSKPDTEPEEITGEVVSGPPTTTLATEQDNPPQETPSPMAADNKSFAVDADEWIVVGASVQGNGHISMNLPCQDSSGYKYLGEGWGIAITADGAGSASKSHVGSAIAVQRALFHFENLIKQEGWITSHSLPSESNWIKHSYKTLKRVHDEIEAFSKQRNVDFKSLSSTIIVVIHAPFGLLVCHIGDGRAGYKDMDGEWHSLITPHKGEEANQTIFIPSEFWNIPFYEMSGVTVPEARVIKGRVAAFTLMSDGCESTSWQCNHFNDAINKYYDPNLPHKKFFDSVVATLQSFRNDNVSLEERKNKWARFIQDGNSSFVKESDDKTMIVGTLYN